MARKKSVLSKLRESNANLRELAQDAGIIVVSIAAAFLLAHSGLIEHFVYLTKDSYIIGSLFAGIFFTSAFTLPLATVALVEIAQHSGHPIIVAFVGAAGGLCGDLVLFFFIKDTFGENLKLLFKTPKVKRVFRIFNLKMFRWMTPLAGALIIASPLPDELGLAMMGLSKLRTAIIVPISYSMNFLGILAVTSIIRF